MSESQIHVLLLEDNPGDARLVRERLSSAPGGAFGLECVERLSEGIQRLARGGVDVTLLDLSLPDSSGLATFRDLHAAQPAVPVVVLSGTADEQVAIQAVQAGAQDYLVKGTESSKELTRSLRYAIERKRAEEQIRRFNAELEQRVAARTAELKEANEDLEAFAYSVSHDLRTPLRHIEGFVGLLGQKIGRSADDGVREYLERISRAARRMGMLIDSLLAFSRLGREHMSWSAADMNRIVQNVIRDLSDETKGRTVEWKIGPLEQVRGDPSMLELAVQNLLSNAVKFTGARNPAVIEMGQLANEGSDATFFVRDNGVGFDMRYADRLFGVFERLHSQEAFEGLGIGLANVQRIIARHGGKIWAESAVDRGATFYFSLHTFRTGKEGS